MKTQGITALSVLSLFGVEKIEEAMSAENSKRDRLFEECDTSYFQSSEPLAVKLFDFIKRNRHAQLAYLTLRSAEKVLPIEHPNLKLMRNEFLF